MPGFSYERNGRNRRIKRRSLAGLLLGAASLVLLPAAIAWACAPSTAQLAFDRDPPSYGAGNSVGVIGSGFARSNPVELTLQAPSGAAQPVAAGTVTDGSGYFEASFALPSNAAPGDYALQAKTTPSGEGHGGQTQPTTATDTFKVMAPAPQGSVMPPFMTPQAQPPSNPAGSQPSARVALRRAIARCKRKHKARRSATARRKKTVAKRRAACVRRARKRYP